MLVVPTDRTEAPLQQPILREVVAEAQDPLARTWRGNHGRKSWILWREREVLPPWQVPTA